MSSRLQSSIKFRCFPPGVNILTTLNWATNNQRQSVSQPLKFQLYLVPGGEHWGVNYMLDLHYSNITQKGKFGTIDSIKILSYRTNLTNIARQLCVLLPACQPCPTKFCSVKGGRCGVDCWVELPPPPLPPSFCLDDLKQRPNPSSSCRGGSRLVLLFMMILINIW